MLQAERDQLSSELARLRVAAVGSEDKESAWMKQVYFFGGGNSRE